MVPKTKQLYRGRLDISLEKVQRGLTAPIMYRDILRKRRQTDIGPYYAAKFGMHSRGEDYII